MTVADYQVHPLLASSDAERAARQAHLQHGRLRSAALGSVRRAGRKVNVRAYEATIAAAAMASGFTVCMHNPNDFTGLTTSTRYEWRFPTCQSRRIGDLKPQGPGPSRSILRVHPPRQAMPELRPSPCLPVSRVLCESNQVVWGIHRRRWLPAPARGHDGVTRRCLHGLDAGASVDRTLLQPTRPVDSRRCTAESLAWIAYVDTPKLRVEIDQRTARVCVTKPSVQ